MLGLDVSSDSASQDANHPEAPVEFYSTPTPAAFNAIMTLTHSVEIALSSAIPWLHLTLALKLVPSLR
jgi:hypothetical protein